MDYVAQWSQRADITAKRTVQWLGVRENKFYDGKQRYGRVNEHNGKVPRTMLRTVLGGSPRSHTIKHDCVRQKTPLTLQEARHVVTEFVQHYNAARLHSALGYVTPRRQTRRPRAIHLRRTQPQTRPSPSKESRRPASPASNRLTYLPTHTPERTLWSPGETNAGSAGTQPSEGSPRTRRR